MKTIREEIKKHIIEELQKAKSEILIAVSWFNDTELFNLICEKAKQHVKIEVIITNDHINIDKNKINWYNLIDLNGKVYLYQKGKIMHLKECIIDDEIFIQGTYNWTNNASKNVESINVFYNNEINIEETKAEYKKVKLTCELLTRNPRKRYINSIIKEINSKYGIFDVETDETYIAAIYDKIREMSDDMIFVRRNHEGGFLNEKLEFVIPLSKEFKYCGDFYYGAAVNIKREYFWSETSRFKEYREINFLVDKKGNEISNGYDYSPIKENIWKSESKLIFINEKCINHEIFNYFKVQIDGNEYYFYVSNNKINYICLFQDNVYTLLNYSKYENVKLLNYYDCFIDLGLMTFEVKLDENRFIIITNKDKSQIYRINATKYIDIQVFRDFIIFDKINCVNFLNKQFVYKEYVTNSILKNMKEIIIDNDNVWLLTNNRIYIFSTKTFKITEEIDLLDKYKEDILRIFKIEKLDELKRLINKNKNDIKLEIEQKKKKAEKEAHDARMIEFHRLSDLRIKEYEKKERLKKIKFYFIKGMAVCISLIIMFYNSPESTNYYGFILLLLSLTVIDKDILKF